ncbi:hypothetical protein PQX77_020543 [Marasmius sp. AFHP31]|nr:hypothetical protein PQX77_020543 [Marasmius sp. AFHP31]
MSNDDIAFDIANFAALAVEWGFYGCSVPLFIITLKELFQPLRHNPKSSIYHPAVNKKAILATFALDFMQVIVSDIIQDLGGLARHLQDPTGQTEISPASYFTRIKQGPEKERGYAFMLITLLADAVVVSLPPYTRSYMQISRGRGPPK